MSDMTACLNDLSYIPPNNEQNKPTQGNIGDTSNEPTQAKRNEFEELYASANEELYPGCDFVTRLDFMAKFTHFKVKAEPRNVRLELAADGFNPFDNLSQSYNILKSSGKDIDVYLRPLIDDLKDLWALKGVETIEVATGKIKTSYVGQRRFLKKPYKWRSQKFNGETDDRDPPIKFTRDEILTQLDRLPIREKGKHLTAATVGIPASISSVLIGGGVTSDDGLVDETSVKGAITGGVDVTV
ncbi:hypothetical protein Tco_0515138 [Tanacetum coccineum]